MRDIRIFPKNHPLHHIVYDEGQREYYNTRTDIYLSDDDISYYHLRPYSNITTPLPKPIPPDYFLSLSEVEGMAAQLSNLHDDTPESAPEYPIEPPFIESLRRRKPR